MRIGIDLDNTIITYDEAFIHAAQERSLVPTNFSGTKQQLRDWLRTLPSGEIEWQKLQGHVYGKGIMRASLYDGVKEFIRRGIGDGHELFIVSHKTEYGHYDESKTNLRTAAIDFLAKQEFFDALGVKRENTFFSPTRSEKVNIIATLSLSWFIDDLVEVYAEPHFPAQIQKILFHTTPSQPPIGDWQTCSDWYTITKKIFA